MKDNTNGTSKLKVLYSFFRINAYCCVGVGEKLNLRKKGVTEGWKVLYRV